MSERSASGSSNLALGREGKPRDKGLTYATDHLEILNKDLLEQTAEYIDYVKIGLSYPLLLDRIETARKNTVLS